ncbi:MAG: YrbL family protein [Verrucomicrobiota bacterium]
MTRGPIILSHLTPIASGNNRDVFAHPDDADLLIKTVKPEALEKRSGSDAPWSKRLFRRYRHYQTFLRECQEHIVSHLDADGVPDFVHTIVGFVETDRGLGLVTKAERDRSGAYAKTLLKIIEEGLFDDEAQAALERFKQAFLRSGVIITDLGLRNLVYSHDAKSGAHFVVIDGYGEKNIIPFNSTFKWCHMRSKRKRMIRLSRTVQRTIDRQKNA